MKILTFSDIETLIIFENKKIQKNAIAKNKKFKQIDNETI